VYKRQRQQHTATLLPNGMVLVTGGSANFNPLASAELYDPASGNWTATGTLANARFEHTATFLPNGNVLAAGGFGTSGIDGIAIASAELYDPASGTWTATATLVHARFRHTATFLPSGKVLVADGYFERRAELYDVGLGFSTAWQPEIVTATPILIFSKRRLLLTGSRFQGISQASGGNSQDSSSNYPIVQLRNLESSEVVFLLTDPRYGWSDTRSTSLLRGDFPPGPALVTVFTNGIPSTAQYLVVVQSH
jgi:hypothetical protein